MQNTQNLRHIRDGLAKSLIALTLGAGIYAGRAEIGGALHGMIVKAGAAQAFARGGVLEIFKSAGAVAVTAAVLGAIGLRFIGIRWTLALVAVIFWAYIVLTTLS